MKAFELPAFGLENLKLVERETPAPGYGQVLIKVKAVSLNYRDLVIISGLYQSSSSVLPIVPASDGVGEVVALGAGVTRVKIGARVAGIFSQRWLSGGATQSRTIGSQIGLSSLGMLAEYIVLPEEGVVKVPDYLSDAEAATLPCAAVTAWHALIFSGKLKAGERVLIQGTGGVALLPCKLQKFVERAPFFCLVAMRSWNGLNN